MIRSALYLLGLFLVFIIATPFIVIPTLYLFGIICYDGPIGAPASTGNVILGLLWLIALLVGLFKTKGVKQRSLVALLAAAVVIGPWMTIQPSNDRDWKPEFGETGWVDVEDDVIVFHNFRNFDYDSEWNEIVNWETRTHHLDELVGIDYFHDAFGGDLIAHPIISFDFGEEGNVCLSIETRREKSESYSELGGLYKMFELQYIFGSEEDLIRLRTNVRDEPVYLYRMNVTKDQARDILFESIAVQNEMRDKPRWYNVLTANCTTSMRAQTEVDPKVRPLKS